MAAVAHPIRPHFSRSSPRSMLNTSAMGRLDVDGDSDSDDDPPPAIKFSKVTQALLADVEPLSPPKRISPHNVPSRSTSAGQAGLDTPSRNPRLKILRQKSPSAADEPGLQNRGQTPPRVVYLNGKGTGSEKRSMSVSGAYPNQAATKREPTPEVGAKLEMVTPAPGQRAVRGTRIRSGSNASDDGMAHLASSLSRPPSRTGLRMNMNSSEKKSLMSDHKRAASTIIQPQENVSKFTISTASRTRNASADPPAPSGTQRMKRVPVGTTGSFFKSRPVRGGFRRRDSEGNISAHEEQQSGSASRPSASDSTPQDRSTGRRSRSGSVNTRATSVEPVSAHDYAQPANASRDSRPASRQGYQYMSKSQIGSDSRPGSRQSNRDAPGSRQPSVERYHHRKDVNVNTSDAPAAAPAGLSTSRPSMDPSQPKPALEQNPVQKPPSVGRPTYRYVAHKINNDASDDQENIPPPTFKRNKDQQFKYLGKASLSLLSDDEKPKARTVEETPVPVPQQQQRKALGAISGNTPHRPAPAPPPKMTVLDTATSTGGASTTKSRKKRQHMVVNGKTYTQMGRLGKGGSSDVYCVMAENYKTFALKRVKLEDSDESAVRGYKGEIDLLKQLTEVERVVRLFDWELNDDKQELSVLMEKGDTDLNRLLTLRLNGADARYDSTFTRYHWKEMLECVQAVHDHDIVHSDLKPANFLLVQGRLKLIDFGIANAIDTDNTCNVHRDNHVGTPNYMSPESITDTNASSTTRDEAGRPLKKDMRIGKSSDVWSLGCILYQMTYGRPPFAHIPNQISRIMAITNPKHVIEFPELGVGDAPVSATLRGTLRRCLNRDPHQRPTVKQLLEEPESFLNPEGSGASHILVSEEVLGQIIMKVIDRCKDRGIPSPGEAMTYPRSFMAKVRAMQEGL